MVTHGSRARLLTLAKTALLGFAGLFLLVLAGFGPAPARTGPTGGGPSLTVLVAARPLAALSVVGPGDLVERVVADSPVARTLVAGSTPVVGRRLLVAVAAGTPLVASMLVDGAGPVSGHRVVRLDLDRRLVASGVAPGVDVDAVAAVDGPGGERRVVEVGTGRVVAVALGTVADATTGDTLPAAASGSDASRVAVSVDCDEATAMRLIWADAYAKTLRLLQRSGQADQAAGEVLDPAAPEARP